MALTGVMAALIAVPTTIIAIPLPPPLSTINLVSTGNNIHSSHPARRSHWSNLNSDWSLYRLLKAGTSLVQRFVPPGFLYIYLVGLVVARGPMALAALLRKKSEVSGMVFGIVIETLIFFSIDFILFGIGFVVFHSRNLR